MRNTILAALALIAATSASAQAPSNLDYATPLAGSWSFKQVATGTEATFGDISGRPQLIIRCTRSTRRVALSKPAAAAAPSFAVWASSGSRSLPTSFNPATGLLSAELPAQDPLLDSIAFSRGRFAVTVTGTPSLVVPVSGEPAHVVEDCRS